MNFKNNLKGVRLLSTFSIFSLTLISCDEDSGNSSNSNLSPVEQPSESIVGTWSSGEDYVIFLEDGTYALAQFSGAERGLEQGTYTFDESTGRFTLQSVTFDQNGGAGFSSDPGVNSIDGDGIWNASVNTLTIFSDEDDDGSVDSVFTLSRVEQTSGLLGTWLINDESGLTALVFNNDNSYLHVQNTPQFEDEIGVETGTFTYSGDRISPIVVTDINGSIGLNDSAENDGIIFSSPTELIFSGREAISFTRP